MPLVRLTTNVTLDHERAGTLARKLSATAARTLGKPEAYVMAAVDADRAMVFGGTADPAALVQVLSLGLDAGACGGLVRDLSALVLAELSIPPERVFVACTGHDPAMFGWKGQTFG